MRGMGRVFLPKSGGQVWWIAYYHRGKEIRESSGVRDKKAAEKLLRQRLAEMGADRLGLKRFVGPSAERITVSELLDDAMRAYCLERSLPGDSAPPTYRSHVQHVHDGLGRFRAIDVNDTIIGQYIENRMKTKSLRTGKTPAPATINKELEVLRHAYRMANEEPRKIAYLPKIRLLKSENARQGFFELADFRAVCGRLPIDFQDFSEFCFWTGMRKREAASILWADVTRSTGTIRLRPQNAKTGEGRTITVVGDLASIIDRRWEKRIVDTPAGGEIVRWVFHREGYPIQYKSFDRAWNAARQGAAMPGALFHDLRRTAIRNMIRAGVPEVVAMRISGHKTRSIFDRYNIVNEADIEQALARTQEHVLSSAAPRKIKALADENTVGSR